MADMTQPALDRIRRIALRIEYDGSRFHGWQIQERHRTVQQVLSDALADLLGHPVRLIGCSRTDTGVHALEHVSHFLTNGSIPADRLPLALNSRLPSDLTAHEAADVGPEFHARYGTVSKTYRYLIYQNRTPSALLAGRAAFLPTPLDLEAMRTAAAGLTGEHDFTAFMDAGSEVQTTIRRIDHLTVDREGRLITIEVSGSGFLYHMVRILSGTLVAVGQGKIRPGDMQSLILSRDRRQSGKTMPASGLYLARVDYDPNIFMHEDAADLRWPTGGRCHV